MRLLKERFNEIKYSAIREFCKVLREKISNIENGKWLCINCGSEQNIEECKICRSAEYVIPLNETTQKYIEQDTIFEDIKSAIREKINNSINKK